MNGITVMMSMAVLGVDFGWQPGTDGQMEYIIQIEPALLSALQNGEVINSSIHPDAGNVRRFIIQVGTGPLPRRSNSPGSNTVVPPGASGPGADKTRSVMPPTGATGASQGLGSSSATTVPVISLPPPPWTQVERDQLHSVLVGGPRNQPAPSRGSTLPPGFSTTKSGTPAANNSVPSNMSTPPSYDRATSNSDGSWTPPANSRATTPVSPPPGAAAPSSNNSFVTPNRFGASVPGANSPSPTGSPKPIFPPAPAHQHPAPIGDPDARARGRGKANADLAVGVPKSNRHDAPSRVADASNKVELHPPWSVPKNSEPSNPVQKLATERSPDKTSDATEVGKPKLDPETARQLDEEIARRMAEIEANPWWPLLFTALGLFASLAANFYLGWVAVGIYRRYRNVVSELRRASTITA